MTPRGLTPALGWIGRHSDEPLPTPAPAKPQTEETPQPSSVKGGTEVYSNGATIQLASHTPPPRTVAEAVSDIEPEPVAPYVPEEDDLNIPVVPGTTCKRRGCGVQYVDDSTSRGDGSQGLYTVLLMVKSFLFW